jgi:peptidoglycan hydrolase-like protein with peptidoglycan-binding domain
MNNDDIKKFINISNLYSEVDLEKNKKVDEGILDWLEKKLGINQDKAEEVVNALPKTAKKDLDTAVDKNKLVTQGNNFATDADGNTTSTDKPIQPGDTSTVGDDSDDDSTDIGGGADQNEPVGKSFADIGQAMLGIAQVNVGDKVTIGDQEATVTAGPAGNFFTDANGKPIVAATGDASTEKPLPADQDQSPQDGAEPDSSTVGDDSDDDSTDVDPNATAGIDGPADAAAAQQSNGSLLGRKLDTTTANLMKAYNDGGKKAMPEIKNLQTALSRLGHDPNGLDGKYGQGTYAAVQAFQKANGLSVDGQAGPNTMAAIKKALDDNFEKNKVTPDDTAGASTEKPLPADQDQSPQDGAEPDSAQTSNDAQAAQDKADADAKDDPMTAANQQKDIDTAQPNADVDRYIELLNKLEGGQVNAGTPNATQGRVVASYDFRDLITLVESKLNEQLTQAEMAELKALHDKVQGHVGLPGMDDEKITNALNRYLKLVDEPAKKQAA